MTVRLASLLCRVIIQSLVLILCTMQTGTPVSAQEKLRGVALVIGNGAYEHLARLDNPDNDAKAIETLFDDLGFDTSVSTDRDARRLKRDLERFAEDARDADVAILYYSGHGIEAGGQNYLVPVDADISSLEAANERLVPISNLIAELQSSVPLTIVMLDACRTNPFPPGAMVRASPDAPQSPVAGEGLAAVKGAVALQSPGGNGASIGTVLAFAADPGRVALDGAPGGNSPYAAAVLKHLSTMSGEEFGTVLRMVAEEVYLKTGGKQRPWVSESLRRLLFFGKAPARPSGDEGDILKERQQLLLTISDLPAFDRKQVEVAAAEGGVPMDALYGMLKALGAGAPKDPAVLDKLLKAQTERLKAILGERAALQSTDPEIARLSNLAREATDQGALSTALRLNEQAKARIAEVEKSVANAEADAKARRIEFAKVYGESAAAYTLAFEPLKAADDYGRASEQVHMWDVKLASGYRNARLSALVDQGDFKGDNSALLLAVAEGEEALAHDGGMLDTPTLVDLRNNIAAALTVIGDHENQSARLEKAAALYRETLALYGSTVPPMTAANTQTRLSFVLNSIAQRTLDTSSLDQAIAALQAALTAYSRDGSPLYWANAENNLGNAYWLLGYRTGSIENYQKAVANYREALTVFTREANPRDWAGAQGNLGNALSKIGELLGDADLLRESLVASRAAMDEQPRDRFPLDWASSQGNIGRTLRELGRLEGDTALVEQAVDAYHLALEAATRDTAPFAWARNNTQLGHTLMLLGIYETSPDHVRAAVAAYSASLTEITFDSIPQEWIFLKRNLANALTELGQREKGTQSFEQAISIYHELLRVFPQDRFAADWGMTQYSLAGVLWLAGLRDPGVECLLQAIDAYRAAQSAYPKDRMPLEWNAIPSLIGRLNTEIARRTGSPPPAAQSAQSKQSSHSNFPQARDFMQFGGGTAERLRILRQRRAKAN